MKLKIFTTIALIVLTLGALVNVVVNGKYADSVFVSLSIIVFIVGCLSILLVVTP